MNFLGRALAIKGGFVQSGIDHSGDRRGFLKIYHQSLDSPKKVWLGFPNFFSCLETPSYFLCQYQFYFWSLLEGELRSGCWAARREERFLAHSGHLSSNVIELLLRLLRIEKRSRGGKSRGTMMSADTWKRRTRHDKTTLTLLAQVIRDQALSFNKLAAFYFFTKAIFQ